MSEARPLYCHARIVEAERNALPESAGNEEQTF